MSETARAASPCRSPRRSTVATPWAPRRTRGGKGGTILSNAFKVIKGLGGHEFMNVVVRNDNYVSASSSSGRKVWTVLEDDDFGVREDWLLAAATEFWFRGERCSLSVVAEDGVLCEDDYTPATVLNIIASPPPPRQPFKYESA